MKPSTENSYPVVIEGAGLCGLSAAYRLERAGFAGYILLERASEPGGLAGTDTEGGFSFDRCIHVIFSKDPEILELFAGQNGVPALARHARRSFCRVGGTYNGFPYQQHNYGLPPGIILRNIAGLIKARLMPGPPPADYEGWIYRAFILTLEFDIMVEIPKEPLYA
jgi:protoporphyrinogen oxidase